MSELQKAPTNPSQALSLDHSHRALDFLPLQRSAQRELPLARGTGIERQLAQLEAQSVSCCVKVESQTLQSRAAILLLRGKVLACMYGHKQLQQYLFGCQAYEFVMRDITHIDNKFDCYELAEPLVLAAGSMFHGQNVEFSQRSHSTFDLLLFALEQT